MEHNMTQPPLYKELLVVWELPRQDVGVEEGYWGSNIAGTGAGRAGLDTARTRTRRRDLKEKKEKEDLGDLTVFGKK